MSKYVSRLERLIACLLAFFIVLPLSEAATEQLPSAPVPQEVAGQTQSAPATPGTGSAQSTPQSQPATTPQAGASVDQQSPSSQQPVGTAAAPSIKAEGVPASRPAGAAIAPAKQKRSRTFAIRVALLVGAGIAIGTVAAASMGSPSRPH